MGKKIFTSRSKTPWDNKSDLTIMEQFIKEKYEENYKVKHPKLLYTNESTIINSITPTECAYCNSKCIIKYGKTNNLVNRYYCKSCNKTFNPLTNTIFDRHKISITEWIEFLLDIFNYSSTTLTSKVNKNSINTSIYWLHKIFLLLEDYQSTIVLSGDVYIDEMFYKVIKSDIRTKDGKQLRGLSQNQYCIGVGYDGNHIIAIVEGLGKTSKDKTKITFGDHIESNSKIIHDDERAHGILIKKLNLINESYNSLWLKTKKDEDNPLRPINHQCDLIRQFLNTHSGFERDDLQNYLNLYCFINNGHEDRLNKVNELLQLALTKKVNLKYRVLFDKDENKNH